MRSQYDLYNQHDENTFPIIYEVNHNLKKIIHFGKDASEILWSVGINAWVEK